MLSDSPSGAILPPWVAEPYRLHSLWEIMHQFNLGEFSPITQLLALWGYAIKPKDPDSVLSEIERTNVRWFLSVMLTEASHLDLNATRISVERATKLLEDESLVWSRLRPSLLDIDSRMRDELTGVLFFSVDSRLSKYYSTPRAGWEAVAERFPNAITDIEEAGKCWALKRHTACVLHLMRVLEVGLEGLKFEVGALDYCSTWKVALDKILRAISATPQREKTPEERQRDDFIRQVVERFTAIKDAVRNPVMHKPARTYSEHEAEEVYVAVRAFMRHLASNLPAEPPSEPE